MTNVIPFGDNALWDSAIDNWNKTKSHGDGYFAAWLALGRDLILLKNKHKANADFGEAVRAHGIDLTSQHQSDAMWLARLDDGALETGRAEFPSSLHPSSLRNKMRDAFGADFGLMAFPTQWGTEGKAPEVLETQPNSPETEETATMESDNQAAPAPVASTKGAGGKRSPSLVSAFGDDAGGVVAGFFRNKDSQIRRFMHKLKGKHGAAAAVNRLAKMLESGEYGTHVDFGVKSFTARCVFPALPTAWAVAHKHDETVRGVNEFCDKLPDYKRLHDAMVAENPTDAGSFCHRWWRDNVTRLAVPAPVAADAPIDHVAATRAAFAAAGVVYEEISETTEFSGHKVADRYTPLEDADIVVCGQVLYSAGSEPADIYQRVWSAYRLWKMWEGNFKRGEPRVVERGFEYRRLSAYLDGIDAVAGRMFWKIGNAMAEHPDGIDDCSGSRDKGAYK